MLVVVDKRNMNSLRYSFFGNIHKGQDIKIKDFMQGSDKRLRFTQTPQNERTFAVIVNDFYQFK